MKNTSVKLYLLLRALLLYKRTLLPRSKRILNSRDESSSTRRYKPKLSGIFHIPITYKTGASVKSRTYLAEHERGSKASLRGIFFLPKNPTIIIILSLANYFCENFVVFGKRSLRSLNKLLTPAFVHSLVFIGFLVVIVISSIWYLTSTVHAAAGINEQINFQGKIVASSNGTNISNGNYDIEFKIHNHASNAGGGIGACSGSCLWREAHDNVAVTDGIFRVQLGSVTAFGSSVDWNSDTLYLSIRVNADGATSEPEMSPRVQFTAVPYAFNAKQVNGLTVANSSGDLTAQPGADGALTLTTNGNANALTLNTAAGSSGNSGAIVIQSGNTSTSGTSGAITIDTGSGADANGAITIGGTNASALNLGRNGVNTNLAGLLVHTSTQTSGTIYSTTDSTAIAGALVGHSISLTGNNDSNFDKTALKVVISDNDSGNKYALVANDGTNDNATLTVGGVLTLGKASTTQGSLVLGNTSANLVTLKSSNSTSTATTFVLPVDDGANGECLKTDGGGATATMSWGTCSAGVNAFTRETSTTPDFIYPAVDVTDDFVLGAATIANASFYVDVSAGALYLGTNESLNGLLTFYSSGAGETDPSIFADSDGDLNITAPSGTVDIGGTSGDIELSLLTVNDNFIGDKTVSLSAAYSQDDFTFKRVLTSDAGGETQGGTVLYVADLGDGTGTTVNGTLLKVNSALTAGTFTGNLLDLQVGSSSKFAVDYTGKLTFNGPTTDITTGTNQALTIAPNGTGSVQITSGVTSGTTTTSGFSLSGSSLTSGSLAYLSASSTDTSASDGLKGLHLVVSDTGNVSSGTDNTYGQYINFIRTGASGGTINSYGQYISATGDLGGTSKIYGSNIIGANADTTYGLATSAQQTSTLGVTTAYGLDSTVHQSGAGSITTAYAGSFQVINLNASATLDNGYGVYIWSAVNGGIGANYDNNYGLYIEDQSAVGSVNSYNLYSAGSTAKNYFAGPVGIGATNPGSKLQVNATADAQSLLSLYDDAGTPLKLFEFTNPAGTMVNGLTFASTATAGTPSITALGSDTDISLSLAAKGTGDLKLTTDSDTDVQITKFTTANSVLYVSDTSGTLKDLAPNAGATQCLTQASSSAPAWGSCGSTGAFTDTAGTITQTTSTSQLNLIEGQAGDYGLLVSTSVAPTVDLAQFTTTNATTTNNVDTIVSTITTATGAGANNSAIHAIIGNAPVDASDVINGLEVTGFAQTVASTTQNLLFIDPASSGNTAGSLYGINIDSIGTPNSAAETALNIGSGWDNAIAAQQAAGTMITLDSSAITQTNSLTGLSMFSGLTAQTGAASNITGASLSMPSITETGNFAHTYSGFTLASPGAITNQGTSTFTFNGFSLTSPGALTQDTAAGTLNWRGLSITSPAATANFAGSTVNIDGAFVDMSATLTKTAGTLNANGFRVSLPTSVTGGFSTINGLSIPTLSAGPSAATAIFSGINIGNITTPGAGTEQGIIVGLGWDTSLKIGDNGPYTQVGNITAANINFSNYTAAAGFNTTGISMSTPAFTQSTNATNNFISWNLSSAGALVTNTTSGAAINWRGNQVQMPNQTTSTAGTNINSAGILVVGASTATQTAGSNSVVGVDVDFDNYTISGAVTMSGVRLTTPSSAPAGTSLRGIDIGGITAGAASESAIGIGAGWDLDIDATTSLEIGIGSTGELYLDGDDFSPFTSDGNSLGDTDNMWSDLFLASGAVINFNNGDVTLTHSADAVSFAGGNIGIGDASPDNALDVNSLATSGNILTVGADSAVTVAGSATALVGLNLDLATNYTVADDDVTGAKILLPGSTDGGSATDAVDDLIGLQISGSTVTVNGTTAVSDWRAVELTVPAATTTAGTSFTGDGLRIITSSDTQSTTLTTNIHGLNLSAAGAITQDTAAGTYNWDGIELNLPSVTETTGTIVSNGLDIILPSVGHSTGADVRGINITGSQTAATAGTEVGINFASVATAGNATSYGIRFNDSDWDEDIFGDAGLDLDVASGQTITIGNSTNNKTITIGTTGAAADTINIGSGTTGVPQIFIGNGHANAQVILRDRTAAPTTELATNGQIMLGSLSNSNLSGRIWIKSNGFNFRFNSAITGADYSEYLQQEETSEPGDVMVLSKTNYESVKRSTTPYDQQVLGVVTQYGTGNNSGDCFDEVSCDRSKDPKWANVGMLGQVYTKISTENGSIQPGDPLTTSSVKGVAMKATKAGRIVGYALDYFDGTHSGKDLWSMPTASVWQETISKVDQPPQIVKVGKIIILLQASWYDPAAPPPDSADDLSITVDNTQPPPGDGLMGNYSVGNTVTGRNWDNLIVGDVGYFGNIETGAVQAIEGVFNNFTVNIASDNGAFQALGANGESVFNVDQFGNANFAGEITAKSISVENIVGIEDKVREILSNSQIEDLGMKLGPENPAGNLGDLAESYPTSDESLSEGELVSLDPNGSKLIQRTSKAYDVYITGVIATKPTLVMAENSGEGKTTKPVISEGQALVKVSTEGGNIKKGDFLTSSSRPGVAMKAKKAGATLGKALENFSGNGVGTIMVSVKTGLFNGTNLNRLLSETESVNQNFTGQDLSKAILSELIKGKKTIGNQEGLSEVYTDRLAAGLEIITPTVTAQDIFAENIKAKNIKAEKIEGLEGMVKEVMGKLPSSTPSGQFDLNSLSEGGLATYSGKLAAGSLTIKNESIFYGMVQFLESITTRNLIVSEWARFLSDVLFKGDVEFEGRATFNKDTAGFAVIKKGVSEVEVKFEKEYVATPLINANITLDDNLTDQDKALLGPKELQDKIASQSALEDQILSSDIKYIITKRTQKSFIIKLNKPAPSDIKFSWSALSIKDAALTESESSVAGESTTTTAINKEAIASPSATPKPKEQLKKITINKNELGFLRVRENPSSSAEEVGQVQPLEVYEVLETSEPAKSTGLPWYKIEFEKGKFGWVSSAYVTLNEPEIKL